MKRLTYAIGLIFCLISCDKPISEFQTHNFIKYMGTGLASMGYDALELPDGGYIITGYDNTPLNRKQILVARIDKAGNMRWHKYYGTEHNEEGRIAKLIDNEVVISGIKTNYITGINEAFIMRVNLDGDSLAYYPYSATNNLIINDMAIANNLIYVAGEHYESTPVNSKFYVACINLNGEIIWQWSTGSENKRQVYKKIFIKDNGNILLTGTSNAKIGSTLTHIAVVELNSAGNIINSIYLDTDTDQEFGSAIFRSNILHILYSIQQGGGTTSKIAKVSANYSIDWELSLSIPGSGTSMVMMNSNTFLLVTSINNRSYFHSLLMSSSGNAENTELKDFPGEVKSIIRTNDEGILSIGSSSPDYDNMVRLIKTDADLYLLNP